MKKDEIPDTEMRALGPCFGTVARRANWAVSVLYEIAEDTGMLNHPAFGQIAREQFAAVTGALMDGAWETGDTTLLVELAMGRTVGDPW
jgi:hypothetical protein